MNDYLSVLVSGSLLASPSANNNLIFICGVGGQLPVEYCSCNDSGLFCLLNDVARLCW